MGTIQICRLRRIARREFRHNDQLGPHTDPISGLPSGTGAVNAVALQSNGDILGGREKLLPHPVAAILSYD